MADPDDDLFGDSDDSGGDTDDMIADARSKSVKPAATKKKPTRRLQKKGDKNKIKKKIPDADNDTDSDDSAPRGRSRTSTAGMSMKERMEALARKRQADAPDLPAKGEKGYESAGSIDSAQFQRTKEDDDFIDDEDEDPSALAELYAEQHFEDEEAEESDEAERKKKKRKQGSSKPRKRGPDALSDLEDGDGEPDNPLLAAVHRMKGKKKQKKSINEWEEEANEFVSLMKNAAEEDAIAIKEKRLATKKLTLLPLVLKTLAKKDMVRHLLDADLLVVVGRWIRPLPNGTLGNVTVRQKILGAIAAIPTGEKGIEAGDLKQSGIGKTVMSLYMHKRETPEMKRQLKALIEQWSRPIFNKSGNMKDLGRHLENRREMTSVGMSRQQSSQSTNTPRKSVDDVGNLIAGKSGSASKDVGGNRVRVPYSKGFQFTIRPQNRMGAVGDSRRVGTAAGGRSDLSKRMMEKSRPASKNQRSANISVEGRAVR